jgi:hypothetical protein
MTIKSKYDRIIGTIKKALFGKSTSPDPQANASKQQATQTRETLSAFFDTRDTVRVNIAAHISENPFEYCLRAGSAEKLSNLNIPHLTHLFDALKQQQNALQSKSGTLHYEELWSQSLNSIAECPITTTLRSDPNPYQPITSELNCTFNISLLENAVDTAHSKRENYPYQHPWVSPDLAASTSCIWLSNHLSLVVLGLVRIELVPNESIIRLYPASEMVERHFRCLWFGSAFEQMSLKFASVTFDGLAQAYPDRSRNNDVQALHSTACASLLNSLRLPFDSGAIHELFADGLRPIISLVGWVMAGHLMQPKVTITRQHAKKLNALIPFETITQPGSKKSPTERLIEVHDNRLGLGSRLVARGVVELAEDIASFKLGPLWHDSASKSFKQHLTEKVRCVLGIDVLDFELNKHHTRDGATPIDIDLWIRNRNRRQIFAIQLKHVLSTKKGGVMHWLSRVRGRKDGLGKGIAQLEHLRELLEGDELVIERLRTNGIQKDELLLIQPVLIHNVGAYFAPT